MPAPLRDPDTRLFLQVTACLALLYAALGLTPSSYGSVFDQIGAFGAGPVAGSVREIRSDEFTILTPAFQAAVRNNFTRFNQTSLYHEDLRRHEPLPLRDWALVFKPEVWAFFVLPPGRAYSVYWAFYLFLYLAGYYLLFREIDAPAGVSTAAAVAVFFCGFGQFWCTTYHGLISVFPWVLLLVIRPMPAWKKTLIGVWLIPFFFLAHTYPTLHITAAWCAFLIVLAVRPNLFRSPGELLALAIGLGAGILVVTLYLGDLIPAVRNTVYPGRRTSPPGPLPWTVIASHLYPFVTFRLRDYEAISGPNICEMGVIGSFLPLLTACATRYRDLRARPATLRSVLILLAAFVPISLWIVAPMPPWIGHVLAWDTGPAPRLLFASGLLLTVASLLLWRDGLVSLSPRRLTLFAVVALLPSILIKWWLLTDSSPGRQLIESLPDIAAFALAALLVAAAWNFAPQARAGVVLASIALLNVYGFSRFNPLQPGAPIFDVPETPLLLHLREEAAASPGGVLINANYLGSILNGLGFRAVTQYLLTPDLPLFRRYFPNMDPARFNFVFNRSSHVRLIDQALPDEGWAVVNVPIEVFRPVRNLRRADIGPPEHSVCTGGATGAIDRVSTNGVTLTIDGWAPWRSESPDQGIRVLTSRPLQSPSLATITRPDVAEALQDYRFVKAGFHLQLVSADAKPLRGADVVLLVFGESLAPTRLPCCGCP